MRECTGSLRHSVTAVLIACTVACSRVASAQSPPLEPPRRDYWFYVGSEASDQIHRLRFGPRGLVVETSTAVGDSPVETEGPHGLQISPDGRVLHFTTGHGTPAGKYWRMRLGPDTLLGPGLPLGQFPASIDLTPDGLYAFVANFNLHGPMVPSSVSVIYTPDNFEVARTETCVMPHGGRVAAGGTRHYSTCMMSDELVEIDTRTFAVSRRFELGRAHETTCSPTWAQPSVDGRRVYVACNKSDEIIEIDVERWAIARRIRSGRGPYNLAVTPDGKLLVATLKQGDAFEIFDVASGASLAIRTTMSSVTHGVAVSPDSRYAFVSSEGVGSQPGLVEVYDLRARVRIGTAKVGQHASGVAFWKMR